MRQHKTGDLEMLDRVEGNIELRQHGDMGVGYSRVVVQRADILGVVAFMAPDLHAVSVAAQAGVDLAATVDAAAKAAARAIMSVVLDTLQADPHQWSTRPCATCGAVSAIAGRDFGCQLVAKSRAPGGSR